MSKSNGLETSLLEKVFQKTAFSWDAVTDLYISLHTSTGPGEGGNQTTNEATYGGYDRVAVARSVAGWTVSGNQASNAAKISFPQCATGSDTVTYVGIGTDASGAGNLLYFGALSSPVPVSTGIIPEFGIGTLVITED